MDGEANVAVVEGGVGERDECEVVEGALRGDIEVPVGCRRRDQGIFGARGSKSRDECLAASEGELSFAFECVEGGRESGARGVFAVGVDEEKLAVGVFGLSGANEPPEGSVDDVGDGLVGEGGDGALGEQDESRGGESFVAEPGLEERESAFGGVVGVRDEMLGGIFRS